MRSFIDEVVSSLYGRYGDDISSLNLVFPSRRARLFFSDALSRVTLRPVWQPRFVGINDLMQQISGIVCGDRIKLVTKLYKVYSRHHDESFDEFYFWGDMLLSDFDQIDKYLIDADVLFTNIGDLHALEDHLAYLTPEQIGPLCRVFGKVSVRRVISRTKKHGLCRSGARWGQSTTNIGRPCPFRDWLTRGWCTVSRPNGSLPTTCPMNFPRPRAVT